MYNIRKGYDSIFPNCVKNVRVQAISDSVKFSRWLIQKILDLLSCDLTIKATGQSLNDRNKIANERQVNNCALRIDRDMCTLLLYIYIVHVNV